MLTPQNADRVRIGLCTDTHVWLNGRSPTVDYGNLQLLDATSALLATLIDELTAAELDLAIHLGDFTCGGGYFGTTPAEFFASADLSRAAFERLPLPALGLPGNHDFPPSGDSWRYVEAQWGLEAGLGCTLDTPYARLVLLNAQGHSAAQIDAAKPEDPIYGWVNEPELARLDQALATAEGRPVLLFAHQLLRPWQGDHPWRDFYLVRNAPDVLAVMARYGNVRAVFQGHAHLFDVHNAPVGNRTCCFTVVPAIVEYPLSWLTLELTADKLYVTLQPLPVPDLRQRAGGPAQDWRAGRPEWQHFCIDLTD